MVSIFPQTEHSQTMMGAAWAFNDIEGKANPSGLLIKAIRSTPEERRKNLDLRYPLRQNPTVAVVLLTICPAFLCLVNPS